MPALQSQNSYDDADYIHIKREPLYVWLSRLVWVILLILLLEYAFKSHVEREPQATITASALAIFLLVAGVIIEVVRHVESQGDTVLNTIEYDNDLADQGALPDSLILDSPLDRQPIMTVPTRDKDAFDE